MAARADIKLPDDDHARAVQAGNNLDREKVRRRLARAPIGEVRIFCIHSGAPL
jgi:hypothetical protein